MIIDPVFRGYPEALRFTNFDGKTPLELAQYHGGFEKNDDVVDFLSAVAYEDLEEKVKELVEGE